MSDSRESVFGPVLLDTFLRTIYGYALVAVVALAFPPVGLGRYAAGWYWLIVPAVILHGLYILSAYNDPNKLSRLRRSQNGQDEIKIRLDAARQGYLSDARKRAEIVRERIKEAGSLASLGEEIGRAADQLDRLIPDLEVLLKRNQRLADDIQRLESTASPARPSQQSLKELKDLYAKQWNVIGQVSGEIATLDANLAVIVNQVGSAQDATALEAEAKQWNAKLGYWKDSIREVYG